MKRQLFLSGLYLFVSENGSHLNSRPAIMISIRGFILLNGPLGLRRGPILLPGHGGNLNIQAAKDPPDAWATPK